MSENKKTTRKSSIELLRIIMMMGTIFLHYNNGSIGGGLKYVEEGSLNHYYLLLTTNMFVCAVNAFIIISGYFLCMTEKRRFIRVIELVLQVIVFNYINLFKGTEDLTIRNLIGCLLPKNYYVILYSVLYLISPYINILFKKIRKDTMNKLLILCMLIFSVYTILVDYAERIIGIPLLGLNSVGANGSQAGYTIINFVLIYMIGAYIRINNVSIEKKKIIFRLGVLLIMLNGITILEYWSGKGYGTVWNYNNPIIIALAAYILILFKDIEINSRIINELAKAAFTCFMFHCMVLDYFQINTAVNRSLPYLIIHQISTAIILYLASYLVYKVYSVSIKPIIYILSPLAQIVDEKLLDIENNNKV